MKPGWTEVALGEVLEQDKNYVSQLDPISYKKLSVKLYGKGVTLDRPVNGADVKMAKHQFAKPGQIIVSEIWAKKGAIGLVPVEGEGALITSHFFLFNISSKKLTAGWMKWLLKGGFLTRQLEATAFGTTGYAAVRPSKFLSATIPLPPLAEQERIVAHLDAIEARLNRNQKLRDESEKELLAALRSAFHKIEADSEWVEMGEVAPLVRREVLVDPEGSYPELGIRSFGRGTFHKPPVLGIDTTKRLFEIHEGDLVFNNVFAWEGAIAVAQKVDHGRVGSHRFITCICDRERVFPEILQFYFQTVAGLEKIGKASPGGAGRNRTLGIKKLEQITVPVPSLEKQREFLKLLEMRGRIQEQSKKAVTRNDALIPSLLDQIFNERRCS